jgi:hypothetical protein
MQTHVHTGWPAAPLRQPTTPLRAAYLLLVGLLLSLPLWPALAQTNGPACSTYSTRTTASGLGNNYVHGVYAVGSTVYAATDGGLSISTNGGSTFTNKTRANGLGSNNVYGVYAVGSTVYAATAIGLSISTNGGSSFTNSNYTMANGLGSGDVRGVYAVGSTVYAATVGGLSISTNGGSSFTNYTTANGLGNNVVLGVYAVGSTVYAATFGGLSISTNGGSTFTNKTRANGLGSNNVYGVYAMGSTVYAATSGATSGGLSISTNGGSSFTNYTTANGLGDNNVLGVYATSTIMYAATQGGVSFCPPGVRELTLALSASPTTILTTGTTTLSATVSGGTTPYSYTFSGPGTITPSGNTASVSGLSAGVQSFTVVVRDATMPASQTITGMVSVTVTPANTAPVATANNNQTATVGMAFAYTVNAFTDPEGQPLSYSASISPANGFSFDPNTRIISGTPSMSGVSSVTVTATDPGSLSASTSFTITVSPVPPTPVFSITGVTTVSCQVLSAGQRRVSFNPRYAGLDGSPVSFSVVNEMATTTNPGPYTLNLYTDNSVITLQARQSGASTSFAYNWLSACSSSTGNTPPTVANPVPPQSATVGLGYTLSLANVFTDAETPNALVLSVTGLPAGLSFVAPSTISGTPSTSGVSTVTVTATDPGSMSASTNFTITVSPAAGTPPPPTGTFSITSVQTISCEVLAAGQRRLTFNPQYAGLNGAPVSFSVVNEMPTTTNPGPYTLNLYTDNSVVTLQAVQSGVSSSFAYNWLSACSSSTTNTPPTVANPVSPQSATVGVGYTLSLANVFTDAETPNQLTLSVSGLPAGLSFSPPSTISGTPSLSGVSTVTVTATDPGSMSASTSFTLTVNPAGGTPPPPSGTFSITGVTTVSCQVLSAGQRRVTFSPRYAGLDGSPVSFSVVNEMPTTTSPGPYTLNLYTDNPVISLRAVQSGVSSSFSYGWLAACNPGARLGVSPEVPLKVVVLGNPVAGETVEVEVQGAQGQSLRVQLTDERGHLVSEQSVGRAGEVERQTLRLSQLPAGVLLLRVNTSTQSQTLKLLKTE